MHFYNIQGFLNVFAGGVASMYVYCKTRNILYVIIEHAAHNALTFIPLDDYAYFEKNGFVLGRMWWIALNAALTAVTIIYLFRVFRKKYTENYFEVNRSTGLPVSGA